MKIIILSVCVILAGCGEVSIHTINKANEVCKEVGLRGVFVRTKPFGPPSMYAICMDDEKISLKR